MVTKGTDKLYSNYLSNANSRWEYGNSVLYRMCKEQPEHKDIDVIVGKIWLIGRSYAAAIERRKNAVGGGDDFYYDVIVTIYHEIGHALFELIMSIPEEDVKKYEDKYCNVFFDDNGIDEEELVEDFGQSFDPTLETKSELRELLSHMLSDDFDFEKYI